MPDVVPTNEARREHLRSMSSSLIAEGLTLRDLKAATSKQREMRIASADDARTVARESSQAIRDTLTKTNARTRSTGLTSVRSEYDVAKREAINAGVEALTMAPQIPGSRTNDDDERARIAANAVHAEMLRRAVKILADAKNAQAKFGSDLLPNYALEEIATTETAAVFHDERERSMRATAERYKGTRWLPAMVMMHDSTLDVRTCSVCIGLNETFRPIGIGFAKPLPVHRRCRCIRVLIFAPIFLGRKEVDQAA